MIPNLPTRRRSGFKPAASWAGAAALTLGFLFGSPAAFAAAPPANTVIGNQASATYSDSAGTTQLATSNLVQTTVQQVGSFTLDSVSSVTTTVVNTKLGAAGSVVYAPHTLTNTGNGSDTFTVTVDADTDKFSKVEVYPDVNGDGVPDGTTPLCTATGTGVCTVSAQTVAGNNGVFRFVVAYTIPGTANTAGDFDTATITATPGTAALYTAPNTAAADKDLVQLTTSAAFNVTKTIGVPSVAPPSGSWPTASTGGPRSAATGCATAWSSTLASSATCQYTVYTLTFNNTGGAPGRFAMSDTLPSGMTYVTGSAVWSSVPGTALGDGAGGDPTGIDFQVVGGNTLNTVVASLGQNVTQTVSFVVLVNSTAAIGTSTTTNTAKFSPAIVPGTVTAASIGTLGSSTNPSAFTVLASYSIAVGTNPSTAATAVDVTPGTPNGNAEDLTTRPSVVAGGSVKFPQTVFNTGTGTDTVNLTVAAGTFPAGTTFVFFAADGVTPLLDTSGDGVPDTGPIAAGGSVNFVLQANVPSATTVGAGPFSAVVTGRSTGDNTKIDATRDTVTIVIGSLVDLTNSAAGTGNGSVGGGDLGPGPSPNPTTTNSTAAGTGTLFSLYVKNNDTKNNAYSLAASQSTSFPGSLPAGWTVKFVDVGGTCASPAVTSVTVAAGAQGQVLACVTPSATQLPVTAQKIYFQVQSTATASTGAIVSDTKTDAVTVTTAVSYSATLSPNNSGQVAPGGTVVYPHTLTNTGSQSCGAYTLTATVPSADAALGWTTAIYIDVNGDGQIDANDTLVTGPQTGTLAPGASRKLLVRVFAPGGATAGATDTVTVTATFTDTAPNCGAPSATDVSTIITGQIRVLKTQAPDANCDGVADIAFGPAPLQLKPGQCIVYKVVATNEGTAPVTNIAINDAVPAYTALSAAQPPVAERCTSTGVSGTALAFAQSPTAVSCGSTANTVAPSGTATLTFAVKINQ
ncbi:hypothetical protein DBV14_07750 [Variovorax sp. KBW07]|uniref:beta strand repeat-containing protein n=1 Tax=Variovorax sp. KBW07 TaxID=2153358 RepID=UPI000F55F149|nr:DUF11 domain-containing protein [Variovorax sp. KBW07]RQO59204.1 hypothetical protein DBV14_07750 [Variovorax sp. KBW07]